MAFARIWGLSTWRISARAVAEGEESPPPTITTISLASQCNVGQWWVSRAKGQAIDFDTAFDKGAGVGLNPGDEITLSTNQSSFGDKAINALRARVAQSDEGRKLVKVLLVSGTDSLGRANVGEHAIIRLKQFNEGQRGYHTLDFEFVKSESGPLAAADWIPLALKQEAPGSRLVE
jgi:hypothetical protein